MSHRDGTSKANCNTGDDGSSGILSALLPEGVATKPVNIKIHMFVDERLIPLSAKTNDGYILSPLYAFEPHGLTFLKHVQVYFLPPVDSKGWHLSLMRAMCDTSTSFQLWHPKSVVTSNSDLEQVNDEDVDSQYDIASGPLSIKHLCWHYWFRNPTEMFLASKPMLFPVCGYQPTPTVNNWNLTITCHDQCLEVIKVH